MTVDRNGLFTSNSTEVGEIIAEGDRNLRGIFFHVNLPEVIHRIRPVTTDSTQCVMSFLSDLQAQPVARHKQSPVPINIKSLMCEPSIWPPRFGVLLRRQFGMVRKHKAVNLHPVLSD